MRELEAKQEITKAEENAIRKWVSLHILRTVKTKTMAFGSQSDYEERFMKELEKECLFSQYFKYILIYSFAKDTLLTSDNPVIEMEINGLIGRFFPLSPSKLLLFSPVASPITHSSSSFLTFINVAFFSSAARYVFSNKRDIPFSDFRRFSEEWSLAPKLETRRYGIQGDIVYEV